MADRSVRPESPSLSRQLNAAPDAPGPDRAPEPAAGLAPDLSPDLSNWLLGSLSSGLVAIDEHGALAMLNVGGQRILGCPDGPLADALGRPCREVLDRQPTVARLLLEALDGRAAQSRAELALDGADDGIANTIGFTLTPVRDGDGRVRGAAMLFRDLTPFERMDEQQRLHERLAALGQMAAGLAHEIRNPLAGMEVIAGLLKRRLSDRPDERALVEQLTGALRELAQTVTDCLEFVRPVSPERGLVEPLGWVEEALATALSRCGFDGDVETALDPESPAVSVDAGQLKAVLTNLIVNALEAMDGDNDGHPKRLQLGLSRVGGEVWIEVADSGPGIEPELREKIFYPFFTTKQTGSGVGLANAQKVIASHGGALELAPHEGRGAAFRLRLPLPDGEPKGEEVAP